MSGPADKRDTRIETLSNHAGCVGPVDAAKEVMPIMDLENLRVKFMNAQFDSGYTMFRVAGCGVLIIMGLAALANPASVPGGCIGSSAVTGTLFLRWRLNAMSDRVQARVWLSQGTLASLAVSSTVFLWLQTYSDYSVSGVETTILARTAVICFLLHLHLGLSGMPFEYRLACLAWLVCVTLVIPEATTVGQPAEGIIRASGMLLGFGIASVIDHSNFQVFAAQWRVHERLARLARAGEGAVEAPPPTPQLHTPPPFTIPPFDHSPITVGAIVLLAALTWPRTPNDLLRSGVMSALVAVAVLGYSALLLRHINTCREDAAAATTDTLFVAAETHIEDITELMDKKERTLEAQNEQLRAQAHKLEAMEIKTNAVKQVLRERMGEMAKMVLKVNAGKQVKTV